MDRPAVKPFQLIGGDAALDFVNTLDDRFAENGPRELICDYSDLVRFLLQAKMLTTQQARTLNRAANSHKQTSIALSSAKNVRELLASILYDYVAGRKPLPKHIENLHSLFREAAIHRQVAWRETKLSWTWDGLEKDILLPVWILSQTSADLLTSTSMELVRACASSTCRWLFLDTSKNHTRRWCDMKICGNRTKARRFKARKGL